MTSTERMKALIEGMPVDRVGVSGWIHMPLVDQNVTDFTRATINFTDSNGWDFVKLMYHGYFFAKAYGAKMTYSTDPKRWWATIDQFVINHPHDFTTLKPLDIMKTSFADDIEFTKRVVDHYKGTVPVLGTLFTPLTFAQELFASSRPAVIQGMMKYNPAELHAGLEAITETCCRFAEALVEAGVDGIFYATQFGSSDIITQAEHDEFARPYDLKVMDAFKDKTWFNIMHVHGRNHLMMSEYMDYPVQAYNWEHCGDTEEASASFASVRAMTDKLLIGGVNQFKDLYSPENDREAVKAVLRARLHECTAGCTDRRFVLAPGCGFELDINPYLYTLMKEVVEEDTLIQ